MFHCSLAMAGKDTASQYEISRGRCKLLQHVDQGHAERMHGHCMLLVWASEDTLSISTIIIVHVALIIVIILILQCKHKGEVFHMHPTGPHRSIPGLSHAAPQLSAWCV